MTQQMTKQQQAERISELEDTLDTFRAENPFASVLHAVDAGDEFVQRQMLKRLYSGSRWFEDQNNDRSFDTFRKAEEMRQLPDNEISQQQIARTDGLAIRQANQADEFGKIAAACKETWARLFPDQPALKDEPRNVATSSEQVAEIHASLAERFKDRLSS